jgi:hypothetical protein
VLVVSARSKAGPPVQDLNGFYVQKFYPPAPFGAALADQGLHSPTQNYIALIADPVGVAPQSTQNVTAHEFAHILGAPDLVAATNRGELMSKTGSPDNWCHLKRQIWNSVNTVPGPTVTSLGIKSGAPGTTVSVFGTNFGSIPGQLLLNGVATAVESWIPGTNGADDVILFVVPQNATSGPIQVITSSGRASSNNPMFTVTKTQ